jgi:hypothetical protein
VLTRRRRDEADVREWSEVAMWLYDVVEAVDESFAGSALRSRSTGQPSDPDAFAAASRWQRQPAHLPAPARWSAQDQQATG